MRWDIFCKVIDNFGDIGVCWRLSRDLARRGQTIRLWVDDARALAWMAPEVRADGTGHPGVTVMGWHTPMALTDDVSPGDVVVEAFGCELPEAFVAQMQRTPPPAWINLEYLSAQAYVERSHGLASPVWHGPGAGLRKRFYYPGFTPRTGGLLREPEVVGEARQLADRVDLRSRTLETLLGVTAQPGERWVSCFCYDHAVAQPLLDAIGVSSVRTHVVLTPGAAVELGQSWAGTLNGQAALERGRVHLITLPQPLSQPEYDRLLACCDFNIVRGEDSALRALWSQRPHLWHIYRQDDGVHIDKLQAFMDHWMSAWPADLRKEVQTLWLGFNGAARPDALHDAMRALWEGPAWNAWGEWTAESVSAQCAQDDLSTQLLEFVKSPG